MNCSNQEFAQASKAKHLNINRFGDEMLFSNMRYTCCLGGSDFVKGGLHF